ncbi:hypothetical protein Bca4012_023827 [Brassica carinata]
MNWLESRILINEGDKNPGQSDLQGGRKTHELVVGGKKQSMDLQRAMVFSSWVLSLLIIETTGYRDQLFQPLEAENANAMTMVMERGLQTRRPEHKNAYATMMYMGTPRDYEFYVATRVLIRSLRGYHVNADIVVIASLDVPLSWIHSL